MPLKTPRSVWTHQPDGRRATPMTRQRNVPASATRQRPGSAKTSTGYGSWAIPAAVARPNAASEGTGGSYTAGKPPPMSTICRRMPWLTSLARTVCTSSSGPVSAAGVSDCEPMWKVMPYGTSPSARARTSSSIAPGTSTPNLPSLGTRLVRAGGQPGVDAAARRLLGDPLQLLERVDGEPVDAGERGLPGLFPGPDRIAEEQILAADTERSRMLISSTEATSKRLPAACRVHAAPRDRYYISSRRRGERRESA